MIGPEPAGGRRAGGGTGWPHKVTCPAVCVGAGAGVAGAAGGVWAGGVWAGACGGAVGACPAGGGGAFGTRVRFGSGAGGFGFAGLVGAGCVGAGMFEGAAGGGSLPGGVWAAAVAASPAAIRAASKRRNLTIRFRDAPGTPSPGPADARPGQTCPAESAGGGPSGPVYRSLKMSDARGQAAAG